MLKNKIFAVLSLLSGLLVCSANMQAKTVSARCDGTGNSDPISITAALALLNPNVPNTLNIFGVCDENVVIRGFNRLTLIGHPGASVTDASGGAAQTILVVDSTDVVFRKLKVDGGLVAVQCDDFSVCRFSEDLIVNGKDGGIQITQSRAQVADTTIRHTGNGLTSLGASSVRIIGGVTLDGNDTGIVVDGGSSMEVIGLTITNSPITGAYVANDANLSLSATTISGGRDGVEVVGHSNVHLGSGNTITGNRQFGIYLFDLSLANFDPGNNITGNNLNGGALDVACFTQYTATRGALTNIGGGTTNCVEP